MSEKGNGEFLIEKEEIDRLIGLCDKNMAIIEQSKKILQEMRTGDSYDTIIARINAWLYHAAGVETDTDEINGELSKWLSRNNSRLKRQNEDTGRENKADAD